MYQFQTDNVYGDFFADKHLSNFSGFEKEIPFYDDENKKLISKIKDEFNGETMEEIVCLREKVYSLKTEKEMKKAKRMRKNKLKKRH